LWWCTLIVVVVGIAREAYIYALGPQTWLGNLKVIGLDLENSAGDWWGTLQFALGAILLALNAAAEPDRRWKLHWTALAALFVYFSLDESAALHERIIPMLAPFHFTGFLRYSWIIPYGLACVAIGLLYLPFVRALPQDFRFRVICAGLGFVAAAIGVESVEVATATPIPSRLAGVPPSSSRKAARCSLLLFSSQPCSRCWVRAGPL
jgi:hypothetical protein